MPVRLNELVLSDFNYIRTHGNAAVHPQLNQRDSEISEPHLLLEHLRKCLGHVSDDGVPGAIVDECVASVMRLERQFKNNKVRTIADLRKAVSQHSDEASDARLAADEANRRLTECTKKAEAQASDFAKADATRMGELDSTRRRAEQLLRERKDLLRKVGALTAELEAARLVNAEPAAPTEPSSVLSNAPTTEKESPARRRPLKWAAIVGAVVLCAGVVTFGMRSLRHAAVPTAPPATPGTPETGIVATPAASATQVAAQSVSAFIPPASNSVSVPAIASVLRVRANDKYWSVDLGSGFPVSKTADSDVQEAISPTDGIRFRLYACLRETWQEHRGEAGIPSPDGLSFTKNGSEKPLMFVEVCRVRMPVAHVCLRLLYKSGQEKIAQKWLERLGLPRKE